MVKGAYSFHNRFSWIFVIGESVFCLLKYCEILLPKEQHLNDKQT